jgi:hypothetical protein
MPDNEINLMETNLENESDPNNTDDSFSLSSTNSAAKKKKKVPQQIRKK